MPTDFVAAKLWSVSESRIFIICGCNLAYFRLAVKIFRLCALRGGGISGIMRGMADSQSVPRFTESVPGRVAGVLLALLWVFSMSGVDAHAFSSYPVCIGMSLVLLVVAYGLLRGYKIVRMSWLGWCSLLAGGYFLTRCVCSYAVVDSWCEAVLIMGAVVYYVAGVYAAQSRSYRGVVVVLAVALLLNVLAYWLVELPEFDLMWTGRAEQTPAGGNSHPTTLFVYKNFAGAFLCVGGCVLGAWSAWILSGLRRVMGTVLALVAVAVSFTCGTRSVYLLLPLALVGLWGLNLLVLFCSNRRIGGLNVVVGGALLVGLGVFIYSFLFGGHVSNVLGEVDSHLRYLIWSAVCDVLPSVPFYGCGANVLQWEIVPWYNEWQLPNYAHNEYLQVWVDYGLLGLLLMLGVLLFHVIQGVRCVVSECVSPARRVLAGLSMLVLMLVAAYAAVDFPWHSFALVALCAFACGVLASPFAFSRSALFGGCQWVGSSAPVVQVRAQKWVGKLVLLALLAGLCGGFCYMGQTLRPAWNAQWEYQKLCAPGVDDSGDARRALIADLLPLYPSPALMDTYFMLPPTHEQNLPLREQLLKQALAANPRQLFTLTMLVDVLGAEQKFEEADRLMRENYVGDSMPASGLNNWPAYYAYNLLLWGRNEMRNGNHGKALSLLEYALAMDAVNYVHFNPIWRGGPQPWKKQGGIKPGLRKMMKNCKLDVRMLRAIGTQPDDSWKLPYTPGGKPALYQSMLSKKRK